jgi:hypothetical protein
MKHDSTDGTKKRWSRLFVYATYFSERTFQKPVLYEPNILMTKYTH